MDRQAFEEQRAVQERNRLNQIEYHKRKIEELEKADQGVEPWTLPSGTRFRFTDEGRTSMSHMREVTGIVVQVVPGLHVAKGSHGSETMGWLKEGTGRVYSFSKNDRAEVID